MVMNDGDCDTVDCDDGNGDDYGDDGICDDCDDVDCDDGNGDDYGDDGICDDCDGHCDNGDCQDNINHAW